MGKKSISILIKLIVLFVFLGKVEVFATQTSEQSTKIINTTKIYFSSGVTKNSGQRRLYVIAKL